MQQQAAAWLDRVLATAPRVAVFDCDGTLWGIDAGVGFMRWSQAEGLLSRTASDWLSERYRMYLAGTVDELTICGEMVQVYAGLEEREMRRAAARYFAAEVEAAIFPVMETLVQQLQELGAEIWAVSSTSNWVIEAGVVERFGIAHERVLAAEVRVVDGRATSDLVAVPTDEGKAVALREAGIAAPDAVFGNSLHDLQMLELAAHPWVIHPTAELAEEAARRGWMVFDPATLPGVVASMIVPGSRA